MRWLTAADLLTIWEQGNDQDDEARALTILEAVEPDRTWHELANLPIGERDTLLLFTHNRIFGSSLDAVIDCPACGELLECTLDGDDVYRKVVGEPVAEQSDDLRATIDGFTIFYRLPTSADLLAAKNCLTLDDARVFLIERCIVAAICEGETIGPRALPVAVVSAVARAISERDRAAVIDLELACPACDHRWQSPLIIPTFLWTKLAVAARRLLLEVDALARVYGWGEEAILSMSATRRQFYLDLVT